MTEGRTVPGAETGVTGWARAVVVPTSCGAESLKHRFVDMLEAYNHNVSLMTTRLPETEFARIMGQVLSPSRAIDTPELLKGRDDQLREITKAWYQGGRQVFIYGYRGVGKTSLAQTVAHQHQESDRVPIRVICEPDASFNRIVRDIFAAAFPSDPRILTQKFEAGGGIKYGAFSAEIRKTLERGEPPEPKSVNEAVQITAALLSLYSKGLVLIIDEFDQLKAKSEQAKFAAYVKEIGDRNLGVKLIFCGIGESIDSFFAAHESAYRQFHTVKLDRLAWEPRFEIIVAAAAALNVTVDETTKIRIARVSDGFPHFIHLMCEKLFWLVYEDETSDMHARPGLSRPMLK